MNGARWAAGLAALITAMLLQATLVGPLLYPLPASLPLVLIAAIALLCGPSTGITVGFAGGLLVDLGSRHPVGVLALTWLGVGLAAGVLGGMVVSTAPATSDRRSVRRSARRQGRRAQRPPSRRRRQALLIGLLAGLGAVVSTVVLQLLGHASESLSTALIRCAPAGLLDAILALTVLPVVAAALRSPSLRAPASVPSNREQHERASVQVW